MSQQAPRLKFTPYPKQQEVLQSDARFRVIAAGRRSGKTLMASVETVRRALSGSDNWHGYWVGAEHRHADTAFSLVDQAVPERLVAKRKHSPPRSFEFTNGAVLEFHTSGGGALVSIGLDWAVCDEAGKEFPERSWTEELRPALSDKLGKAMFISTPGGRGWFYRMWQRGQSDDNPDVASWRWATYENPHVPDSEVDDAKTGMPENVWRQEYLAEFVSETGGVFERLDERMFHGDWELPLPPEGDAVEGRDYAEPPYAIGVDLAQHQDYRVTVVLDAAGRIVYFDRDQKESWPQIRHGIIDTYETYPGPVAIDASQGNEMFDRLRNAGVQLEPVKWSGPKKRELIQNLITRFESGELTSPDIPILRQEMETLEYDMTSTGKVSYDAAQGFHDDTVDALALAADALDDAAADASTTARVGGQDRGEGPIFDAVREHQRRGGGNRWK